MNGCTPSIFICSTNTITGGKIDNIRIWAKDVEKKGTTVFEEKK